MYLNQFNLDVTLLDTRRRQQDDNGRGDGREDQGVEKGEQEGPGPLGFHDLGCIGRCGRTYGRRMPHTTPRLAGAAEGKNKVGVSRPRYVRACTRQREIRGHKPAYYAPPRATNTPNNGRSSAWRRKRRSGRYVRPGIVLNYNNSGANYQTDREEGRRRKAYQGPGWLVTRFPRTVAAPCCGPGAPCREFRRLLTNILSRYQTPPSTRKRRW